MWADTGSENRYFVYHSDVSWQSRGNAFQRAVTLLNDVKTCVYKRHSLVIKAVQSQVDIKESYLSDSIAEIGKFNNSAHGSYHRKAEIKRS
jgi:hypothetical protein